jgi:2-polyprenyl-3-methyl-5-hydroxy-6-metoxy-1,4-benzoquinol methylase
MRYLIRRTYHELFSYPRERILPEEREGEYWQARRGGALATLRPWQLDRAQIIERYLARDGAPMIISDVGCGGGAMLRYMLGRLPITEGRAYDNDAGSLEDARGNRIRAIELDLRDTAAYGSIEPADYYFLLEILEHLPRPELLLSALRGKARRGIFFSVPNTGYMTHRFRLFLGKMPAQWVVHPGEHLRFWTIRDMRWWLAAQAFKRYEIVPYRGVPVLNKLWPNLFAAGIVVYLPLDQMSDAER